MITGGNGDDTHRWSDTVMMISGKETVMISYGGGSDDDTMTWQCMAA